MKDSLLIDSGLPNQFWAEAMDTANYLRNRLPTRRTADRAVIIPEEAWTEIRQNLEHVRIFGSRVSTHIPSQKRSKSDVHKTWNGIFIGYTDTTKHLRAWAPKTHQVLIASEPIVNESKRGADLLTENPMPPPPRPLRQPVGEPSPRGRPRERPRIENEAEHDGSVEVEGLDESAMRIKGPHNQLVQKPRTDVGGTSGENPSEGLVRPARECAKSVTETSSKVREPKIYDEAIHDSVHGNRWREAIDEELWNLDSHQTWSYTSLPSGRKAMGCKWVFRV